MRATEGWKHGELEYLIHHIFLPPKLPSGDDSNPDHEKVMVKTTINALQEFKNLITEDQNGAVDSVIRTISSLATILDSEGHLDEAKLSGALTDLPEKGGTVLLHIRAQNAGVMIDRSHDLVHVEAFELSPLNESVITTKGRLRRCFPGPAVALTMESFRNSDFQATMAHTLAKMSHQPAVGTKMKAKKAGQLHDEERDTVHPKMVTELFFGYLNAIGTPADIKRLWKHTREEVMWLKSLLPWRRSPVWMLLRVAMHQVFSRLADAKSPSADLYKTFMAFLMAKLLSTSVHSRIACDLLYAMNAKLARRLLKLDPSMSQPEIAFVGGVMRDAAAHIRGRWKEVIRQASPHQDLSSLEALDFKHDVATPLEALAGL